MNIIKTLIDGCFIIERDFFKDERGYFSRGFCKKTLEEHGINGNFVQSNISNNLKKYTLRGLHSQKAPYGEDKMVTCLRGEVLDVCVDVRENSPTYKKYVSVNLTEQNGKCLYIPKGCAHGYISLTDNSQIIYFVTQEYVPESEKCYSYDDPAFNIDWAGVDPKDMIISEKDKNHKAIGE